MTRADKSFVPLSVVAEEHGVSVRQLREVAMQQNGIFTKPRFSRAQVEVRWPRFRKNPSGRYGITRAEYALYEATCRIHGGAR